MIPLIDTHAHLTEEVFRTRIDDVIERSNARGVAGMIVPGYTRDACFDAVRLAGEHPSIRAAVGINPLFLTDPVNSPATDPIDELETLIDRTGVIAIGEIGLDYRHASADRDAQRIAFRRQLDLAMERDLPVILHAVRAEADLLDILRRYSGIRGIVHRVSCSLDAVRQLMKLKLFFSVGPDLFIPGRSRLHELVRVLPDDRMLLETDCPFSRGLRGDPSGPWDLPDVLEAVAGLRGDAPETLAASMNGHHALFGCWSQGRDVSTVC